MAEDLIVEVQRLAASIVDSCQDRVHGRLDYSEDSLAAVEELLNEASAYVGSMSDSQIDRLAQEFGCYILEVGRRAWGGRYLWHPDREAPVLVVGEPEFRVAMVTWDKANGRLRGDQADNIPFFYAGFADRVRGATSGVEVLYV